MRPSAVAAGGEERNMRGEKVLIVGDKAPVLEALSGLLRENGCEPETSGTAEEGLDLLAREMVSLALVDVTMPGKDGLPLAGKIKKISPDTEVVILTDGLSRETAIRGIPADVYDFLPTPFENLEDVRGTVRRALEKRALSLKIRQLDRDLEIRNRELSAALKRQNSLIRAGLAMGGISTLPDLLDFFIGLVSEALGVEGGGCGGRRQGAAERGGRNRGVGCKGRKTGAGEGCPDGPAGQPVPYLHPCHIVYLRPDGHQHPDPAPGGSAGGDQRHQPALRPPLRGGGHGVSLRPRGPGGDGDRENETTRGASGGIRVPEGRPENPRGLGAAPGARTAGGWGGARFQQSSPRDPGKDPAPGPQARRQGDGFSVPPLAAGNDREAHAPGRGNDQPDPGSFPDPQGCSRRAARPERGRDQRRRDDPAQVEGRVRGQRNPHRGSLPAGPPSHHGGRTRRDLPRHLQPHHQCRGSDARGRRDQACDLPRGGPSPPGGVGHGDRDER